jgi:RimJ/RimL family protein N-acetyltransferase
MKCYKEFSLNNGNNIVIRNAVDDDANKILDFLKDVFSETDFLDITADEFFRTEKQQRDLIRFYNVSQNSIMLLAVKGDNIAGILTLTGKIGIKMFHRATLGLALKKKYWGMGIAHTLMSTALEVSLRSSLIKLELEVVTVNARAVKLYKKFGFSVDGIIKYAKIYDGKVYDHYIMSKILKELQ